VAKPQKILISFLFLICFAASAGAIDPAKVTELAPMGNTTGIKMFSDGVIVVDTATVETKSGAVNPAKIAGISKGDIIKKINGERINSNESLKEIINGCHGKTVSIELARGGETVKAKLTPVTDRDGELKAGLWIRDSMAGIGTITFYDPQNKIFGALGHGICDTDTNVLIPFASGTLMESKVIEVKPGKAGEPGELVGEYNLTEDSGVLKGNTQSGIFGTIEDSKLTHNCKTIPIGRRNEVHTGKAQILSNVKGTQVQSYDVEIIRIFPSDGHDTKNMMLKVTDEKLIGKTGGIVQGMSGSPIIQDGKLVGAVTHVLVNDPTRGYGIFIENMLEAAE